MKMVSKILALLYIGLAGFSLVGIFFWNIHGSLIVVVVLYVATGLALLSLGGKFTRVIGYIVSGVTCLNLLTFLVPISNGQTPMIENVISAFLVSALGLLTIICINKNAKNV